MPLGGFRSAVHPAVGGEWISRGVDGAPDYDYVDKYHIPYTLLGGDICIYVFIDEHGAGFLLSI